MTGRQAYPLDWPEGWPRTPASRRVSSCPFRVTFAQGRDDLVEELRLLGATGVVLSTDIPVKRDGLPYAGTQWRAGRDDPGVAVYFTLERKPKVVACDRYASPEANLRAIGKSIEALRGLRRWGASGILERAFAGFDALPNPSRFDWRAEFAWGDGAYSREEVLERYKALAFHRHPDRGGTDASMARLTRARDEALRELDGGGV